MTKHHAPGLWSWQRCLSSSSWCYLCRLQPCRAPAGAAPTGTTRVGCKICKGLAGATRATCDLCTPPAGSNRVGCEPWQPQLASPEFQRLPTSTPGLDGPIQSEPGASGICSSRGGGRSHRRSLPSYQGVLNDNICSQDII